MTQFRSPLPDPVELTRELVRIPSVNPSLSPAGTGEVEIARRCANLLEDGGFELRWLEAEPGRPSIVARRSVGDPSGGPCLILNGHLDTVGIEGMSVDPFEAEHRDGRIFGRGSADMKSGVAALLVAALAVARDPGSFCGEILVALTADEEHASIGLRHLLELGALDPVGGADTPRFAIVTEPTSLQVMPANKGFVWFDLEAEGVAAHGSRPDRGRDAIRTLGRVLAALDLWEELARASEPHPLLGHPSIHAGTVRGGTSPSVYPAHAHLVLEARTLPRGGEEAAMGWLTEAIRHRVIALDPETRLRLTRSIARPPAELPLDAPLVTDLLEAAGAEGHKPALEGMSAWVESAFLNEAGIPALCFGPGSIEEAHTDAESVPVDEIRLATRILERWLRSGRRAP